MEITITLIGTFITLLGTGVTLIQAFKVQRYKKQITLDLRKISLREIITSLKRVQEEERKLSTKARGQNIDIIYGLIQSHIDSCIHKLHINGPDSIIRDKLQEAQAKFHNFQITKGIECRNEMHIMIQDVISLCEEKVSNLKSEI